MSEAPDKTPPAPKRPRSFSGAAKIQRAGLSAHRKNYISCFVEQGSHSFVSATLGISANAIMSISELTALGIKKGL